MWTSGRGCCCKGTCTPDRLAGGSGWDCTSGGSDSLSGCCICICIAPTLIGEGEGGSDEDSLSIMAESCVGVAGLIVPV